MNKTPAKAPRTIYEQATVQQERSLDAIGPNNRALAERFRAYKQPRVKPTSLRNYLLSVATLDQITNDKPALQLGPEDIDQVAGHLRRHYSGTRVPQMLGEMRLFLRWAWIDSPTGLPRRLEESLRWRGRLTERTRRIRLVTDDEMRRMVDAMPRIQDKALLWLYRYTGFRASEATALRIRDLHFKGETLVSCTLPDDPTVEGLKTRDRSVPIAHPEAVRTLRAWVEGAHPQKGNPDAFLLVSFSNRSRGRRILHHNIDYYVRKARQAAGIEHRITPHDFRHTLVTELMRKKWDHERIRKLTGWGPGTKMFAIYGHLSDEDLELAVQDTYGIGSGATQRATAPVPASPVEGSTDALASSIAEAIRKGVEAALKDRPTP